MLSLLEHTVYRLWGGGKGLRGATGSGKKMDAPGCNDHGNDQAKNYRESHVTPRQRNRQAPQPRSQTQVHPTPPHTLMTGDSEVMDPNS